MSEIFSNLQRKEMEQNVVKQSNEIKSKKRIITNISWMIETLKIKFKMEKFPLTHPNDILDSEVDYSPQLKEAINLLEQLKND